MDDAVVQVLLQVKGQLEGLTQAQAETKNLQNALRDLASAGKQAQADAGSGGMLNSIMFGLGAGAGIGSITSAIQMLKSTTVDLIGAAVNSAQQIKNQSEDLGIGAQAYQVLAMAAEHSAVPITKVNMALAEFKKNIDEAADGGGKASIFEKLGLNPEALATMPLDQAFAAYANAIANATDQSEAFNDNIALLGQRNGPQMLAVLRSIANGGFDEMNRAMVASGEVMDDALTNRLTKLATKWEDFKTQSRNNAGSLLDILLHPNAAYDALLNPEKGATGPIPTIDGVNREMQIKNDRRSAFADQGTLAFLKSDYSSLMANKDYAANLPQNFEQAQLSNLHSQSDVALNLVSDLRSSLPKAFEDAFNRIQQKVSEGKAEFPDSVTSLFDDNSQLTGALKGVNEDGLKRIEAFNKALEENARLKKQIAEIENGPGSSAYTNIKNKTQGIEDPSKNPNYLTRTEGLTAGAMEWADSLGSQGQQVASAIHSTIGEAVNGISQGITGWISGTESFGQALSKIGSSILQTLLQTIIQMGVQWVVMHSLAAGGFISLDALQSTIIAKKATEINAANAATLPGNEANAAAASVGSFGIAAVLGLAALLAVMAAFGGFRETGGPVSAGSAYVVGEKRPELFIPHTSGTIIPSLSGIGSRASSAGPSSGGYAGAGGAGGGSSTPNVHVYVDKSAYLGALRDDVTGIAHEVYDKRERSA